MTSFATPLKLRTLHEALRDIGARFRYYVTMRSYAMPDEDVTVWAADREAAKAQALRLGRYQAAWAEWEVDSVDGPDAVAVERLGSPKRAWLLWELEEVAP